jgi:hypothetical protein
MEARAPMHGGSLSRGAANIDNLPQPGPQDQSILYIMDGGQSLDATCLQSATAEAAILDGLRS